MPCQCAQHGPLCPYKEILATLELNFFNETGVWRRPDMSKRLTRIKHVCKEIRGMIPNHHGHLGSRVIDALRSVENF